MAVQSIRITSDPDANLGETTAVDIVFVYESALAATLPRTSNEWFANKRALLQQLGGSVDVESLEIPPAFATSAGIPSRASKAVRVFIYANMTSPSGQRVADVTRFHEVVVQIKEAHLVFSS